MPEHIRTVAVFIIIKLNGLYMILKFIKILLAPFEGLGHPLVVSDGSAGLVQTIPTFTLFSSKWLLCPLISLL